MPDVPSLSLAIIGLHFFLRWVEHGKSSSLFLAALAISLSFLTKITSIIVIAPLAVGATGIVGECVTRRRHRLGDGE